jgi:hypothetical protein
MVKISSLDKEKLLEIGRRNQQKISAYSPEYFAENVMKAASF